MSEDDSAGAHGELDDFQRWYFGGSPPEADGWERHAFEDALQGAPCTAERRLRGAPPERAGRHAVHRVSLGVA